jgi:hypothetical protein
MNEMIEIVAKAIEDYCWKYEPHTPINANGIARAAIAVMREPTEAMLDAGEEKTLEPDSDRLYIGYYPLKFAWEAMIDRALVDE